jgi:hypothetical protein
MLIHIIKVKNNRKLNLQFITIIIRVIMTPSNKKKINIFSDLSLLNHGEEPVTMLLPFIKKDNLNITNTTYNPFDVYKKMGKSFFNFCSLEKSDIAVFPIRWEDVTINESKLASFKIFYDQVQDYGIPIIIFFLSDSDQPITIKNTTIFRTSLKQSIKRENEFAFPGFGDDIIGRFFLGNQQVRIKEKKATLGFTGYAPKPSYIRDIYNWTESFFGFKNPNKGSFSNVRCEALNVFSKSDLIKKNFVTRKVFWSTQADSKRMEKQKEEFVANMINRGGGNFSFRFYETLSCGRIPLFIDTDCVLPYDFEIDYKHYCVWVDNHDLFQADKILSKFHENISEEGFISRQIKCRRLWLDYLSPEGFFSNFYKHFK